MLTALTRLLMQDSAQMLANTDMGARFANEGFRILAGLATTLRPLPVSIARAACCTGPNGTGSCQSYGFACNGYSCWSFGGCTDLSGFCPNTTGNCWSSTLCPGSGLTCCDCSCVNFDTGYSTYCYCEG